MGERQQLADHLRPARHAGEREHEPRQQDVGQEEHERHLDRLQLVLGDRRERVADRQIGGDEQRAQHRQQGDAAGDRHVEDQHPEHDDQRRLDEADHDVGGDLAQHDLDRLDRHGEQAFHGAALHLARHRQRREDQHGHGQDGAEQSRHDVEAGHGRRVVATVLADLEGRHALDGLGQAAVARQRRTDDAFQGTQRRARRHRIAGIGRHQQRRDVAAPRAALEPGRDLDAEQDRARSHPVIHLRFRAGDADEAEIAGVAEGSQDRAGQVVVLVHQHRRRQLARRRVDGEAEQQQLHDRNEDHGRKRHPVAAELHELLDQHGPGARCGPGAHGCGISGHLKLSCERDIRSMKTSSSVGSEMRPRQVRVGAKRVHGRIECRRIASRHVQAGTERRHHVDARHAEQLLGQVLQIGPADVPGTQMRLLDHLLDGALGQQLAVGDVGDLVAALGLVHVVRRDQHGHALGGELVDLAPELAPRLGIDAGGRLVEQQQLGLRQDAGAERQPLLPAARQRAGQLLLAAVQSEPLDGAARLADGIGQPVHARHELQVLLDREVLIQTEALRHVTDVALDLLVVGADVEAQRPAASAVGREQPAQHAQRGGLARAVGTEEAVDLAALDLHRQIAHDHPAVEGLGQALDVDHHLAVVRVICWHG